MRHLIALLAAAAAAACAPVHEPGIRLLPEVQQVSAAGALAPADNQFVLTPATYRLNPGDILDIKFPRRPAYSDSYVIRPDGMITVPWVGSVMAAGRTADELEESLISRYAQLNRRLPPPSKRRYLLQVDDVLDVRFPFSPELSSEVVVRADGRISLPLIDSVIVEGSTPEQLRERLVERYAAVMTNPELAVMVKEQSASTYEYNGEIRSVPASGLTELAVNIRETLPLQIYVGGEVPAPGIQPYRSRTTALQAIYAAGGPTIAGDVRSVVILRRGVGQAAVFVVRNLEKDLTGAGTEDIALNPFDVVIVPRSTITKVGDALDAYVYRIIRPLANSSLGFFFTKQIGVSDVNQRTTIENP